MKVERAKFTLKGEFDPTKKPKQKKRKEKEKLKKKQEALFAWKPEKLRGERPKCEKVVVVKNAFQPQEFNNNVELILELKEDFRDEAGKLGNCRRVEIYDVSQGLYVHCLQISTVLLILYISSLGSSRRRGADFHVRARRGGCSRGKL